MFLFKNLSLSVKLALASAIPLLMLIIISLITYFSIQQQDDTNTWVEHTHEVIADANLLMKLLVDMETGKRGFLITGKENFLEPYYSAKTQWTEHISLLKELVSDNPPQVEILNKMGANINREQVNRLGIVVNCFKVNMTNI